MSTTQSSAVETLQYWQGEFHRFQASGEEFLYLVPSGGIFGVSPAVRDALDLLAAGPLALEDLLAGLVAKGYPPADADGIITELHHARVIRDQSGYADPPQEPVENFPLQSLVLNLTNQCNLSCQYCYEYGEDKVATPDGKPKFMNEEVAPGPPWIICLNLPKAVAPSTSPFLVARR